MVRAIAERMLASTVLRGPCGAREAIYEALCDRLGTTETMVRSASRAGITGSSASGQWGTIQSAASDRATLPAYARTGEWAKRTHDVPAEFFSEAGGAYLDIGANIGLTTLPVARNPLVNCFAFGADRTNLANFQGNVQRNAMHTNVVLHHRLALLDRAGSVRSVRRRQPWQPPDRRSNALLKTIKIAAVLGAEALSTSNMRPIAPGWFADRIVRVSPEKIKQTT